MNLGSKIKEEKKKQNIERKTISEKTDVHPLTIKKMEDTSDGALSKIKKVLNVFGYNRAELIIWKENEQGKKSGKTKIEV